MSEQNGMSNAQINFQDGFRKFLQHLNPKQGRAWKCYETLRQKLTRFFRSHNFMDPEELTDIVIDRIVSKPDIHKIVSVEAFAFGIARNVGREMKRTLRKKTMTEDFTDRTDLRRGLNTEDFLIEKIHQERKKKALMACMQRLKVADRQLLVDYYCDIGNRLHRSKNIAQQLAISRSTVRCRVSRLLTRIRQFPEFLLFREIEHRQKLPPAKILCQDQGDQR